MKTDFKYYDTYARVNGSGFVLYYYNENTGDFDKFQDNFETIELAENHAKKDGYLRKPMWFRN